MDETVLCMKLSHDGMSIRKPQRSGALPADDHKISDR